MEDEEYTYLPPVNQTEDEYTYLPPDTKTAPVPAGPEMTGLQRIWANARTAAQEGFGGQIAQKYYDWTNYGHDILKEKFPNASQEEIETMSDKLIAQSRRALADDVQRNLDADPTWKPDASYWDNAMRTINNFTGGLIGSSDPTMLIAPGKNAVQRMGAQGVVSGAADAAYQGINIAEGYKEPDEFDLAQVGMNTLFGVAGQGLFEIPGFVRNLFEKRGKDTTPGSNPKSEASPPMSNEPLRPEVLDEWNQLQATGTAQDMIDFFKRENRMVDAATIDRLNKYAEARDAGGPVTSGEVYSDPIEGAVNIPAERNSVEDLGTAFKQADEITITGTKAKPSSKLVERAQNQIVNRVNNITEKWTNAPEFEVHQSFNDLPDVDPNAIGVTTPEGKVLLNVESIAREAKAQGVNPDDIISAVTFHEGLGHHGLTQKFGDDLDNLLDNLYARAPSFQKKVDKWIENNPDAYAEDLNPTARATEEVLAEMSEAGKIDPSIMERLRAWLRKTSRSMGLDLDFNDNEIKVILGMAHNATVNGMRRDVVSNGFRYSNPVDDEADLNRVLDTRPQPERIDYPETPELGPIPDDGARMPKPSLERGLGMDDRDTAKYNKQFWREKQAQEPLGTEETLDFENGRSADITTYNPRELQQLIERRMNGENRYMRRRTIGSNSEGTIQGSSTREEGSPSTLSKFRSNRPIESILDEVAPEKTSESWDQWIEKANDIRMTTRMAEALSKGAEVPELKAAERFLVESGNRIFDLSKKEVDGTITANERYQLGKEMERAARVSKVVQDIVTNAARILNSRKIEVGSDRALMNSLRTMMRTLDADALSTPEGISEAAKKLVKDTKKAKNIEKGLYVLGNILNLPRSLMSSMDFSAPFRQAILLTRKKAFWKNLPPMFRAAFSEKYFKEMNDEIKSRPTYNQMKRADLALTEVGNDLTKREEDFLSDWANKIPILGRVVRGSERAYSGFLNKVRADVFDDLVKKMGDAGVDLSTDPKALNDIARFVNVASGRGSLGTLNKIAPTLAGIFFSPRLMASRIQTLNPAYYTSLHPVARKEAVKSLLATAGIASTILGLLAANGVSVETDPRSSDFAKAKIGDTRYDILGGFSQYITLGSRLLSNQTKTIKGDVKTLGEGFGSKDRVDVLTKFLTNKGSPIASFVTDYLRGEDAVGEPFEAKKAVVSRFIPMFAQDVIEMSQKYGVEEGTAKTLPAIFGVGVQDYSVTGSDRFGRDYNTEREDDSVISEVDKLFGGKTDEKLRDVPKNVTVDGQKIELTEEQHLQWQKKTGEYFLTDLREAVADPVWSTLTEEEKIEEIRLIRKDAKADARDELNIKEEEEMDE